MPCVKWGIGTRYCRSFQRRHSICPIRVSCITGSPGLNRVKWNRIEQYRIVFDRGMSALRPDFPSRSIRCSVLSSFPYSIKGGGGGGERGSVDYYVQTLTEAFDHVQEISGPRIPRKISASSKLPCPPTRGCRKFLEPIIVNFV